MIKEKYLTHTALVVRGSSQLQQIELEPRHVELLRRYSEIVIRMNYLKEPVQFFVERFAHGMADRLRHENRVLRALPQN
jgi:hypothetical protein